MFCLHVDNESRIHWQCFVGTSMISRGYIDDVLAVHWRYFGIVLKQEQHCEGTLTLCWSDCSGVWFALMTTLPVPKVSTLGECGRCLRPLQIDFNAFIHSFYTHFTFWLFVGHPSLYQLSRRRWREIFFCRDETCFRDRDGIYSVCVSLLL